MIPKVQYSSVMTQRIKPAKLLVIAETMLS